MKKSKINLIINREDYQKFENYFFYLKIILTCFSLLFFIVSGTFFYIINNKSKKSEELGLKKITLLNVLNQKTEDEAKFTYIEKKYQDLTSYLNEDAYSSPYYSLLNSTLKDSSEAATLKSFIINKDRVASFTIAFSEFSRLRDFFGLIESETFLKNFESISLKSFSVIGATVENKENYELSFNGKFVKLKRNF
jgi:hypothetical protein